MITILSNGEDDRDLSFIGYFPNILDTNLETNIKEYCHNLTEFRGGYSSFGKPIPRVQRWYQGTSIKFS